MRVYIARFPGFGAGAWMTYTAVSAPAAESCCGMPYLETVTYLDGSPRRNSISRGPYRKLSLGVRFHDVIEWELEF